MKHRADTMRAKYWMEELSYTRQVSLSGQFETFNQSHNYRHFVARLVKANMLRPLLEYRTSLYKQMHFVFQGLDGPFQVSFTLPQVGGEDFVGSREPGTRMGVHQKVVAGRDYQDLDLHAQL